MYPGFRRGDSELLEGCLFWYNAYSLLFTTFRSCISFCVGDGTEIRDFRAIENTKCQNDKKRVEALSSAEVSSFGILLSKKHPIFFLFSFFIFKFAKEARKCPWFPCFCEMIL